MRFVIVAVVLAAAALTGVAGLTYAQSPPTRFTGRLTIDGQPAPANTRVIAEVNNIDCSGYPNLARPLDAGNYVVDGLSEGSIAGCARPGDPVFFRVGTRYAAQTSTFDPGTFVVLDLTISGAALKPVVAGAQPTVTPTATPAPVVTETPTPTPTPSAPPPSPPYALSVLDLGSPCIPSRGETVCDDTRQKLWTGDQAAWIARYQAQGLGTPTPDDVFVQTFGLRIESGDPAAISAVAQGLGWPHLRIVASRFRGVSTNETDEWVEIRNLGGAAQDMTGWSVRVGGSSSRWTFQDGFSLQPGQTCKFYTGAGRDDSCPGSTNISQRGVLENAEGTISLWVDFLDLKADEVRYNADPVRQPTPPNLQGYS